MEKYQKPMIQSFSKDEIRKQIAEAASCNVVCTVMYGYCSPTDNGWV